MPINRRAFLKRGAASLLAGSFGSALGSFPSLAMSTSGYKALVCVFLYGGMDGHDTIIPFDNDSYQRWSQIRRGLIDAQGNSRQAASLLPLTPLNGSDFGGRQFALPPEMPGLHQLFHSGKAAIVGNVGPLVEPLTASQFFADSARLPSRLFSHNDQQATWMSGAPEGAQFGWAGLFSDAMSSRLADASAFSTITTGGSELLITGRQTSPYQVIDGGALQIDLLEDDYWPSELLRAHFRAETYSSRFLLGQDMMNRMANSFDANQQYNQALQNGGVQTLDGFPSTELGVQLRSVAQSIQARDQLGLRRQIFVVALGGFDTHSAQARQLPGLQRELDAAILAFDQAMTQLGTSNDVTLFTASDFGRTLAINGDGTDHGWAGHHFVVGGSVNGSRLFGDVPIADFGHELDAGNGRMIPTLSVEQYTAALGQWFGLDESELRAALPNLDRFGERPALLTV